MRKTIVADAKAASPGRPRGVRLRLAVLAVLAFTSAACASPEQKLERYIKSGGEYLEEGKLGLANVQYLNALKIDDANVTALSGLAKIAEKRSNYEQMFGLLQRITAIDPENVAVRLDLAKLQLLSGNTAASLDLVNGVIEAAPKNADALAIKAAVMFRLQNVAEAVDLAKQALAINPTSQEAVAVLAGERVNAKDLEGALALLDEAIARDPKAAVLHILRVQTLTSLGRTGDIDAAYAGLIKEYPDNADYRRLYASTLIAENKLDEARTQLAEVVRIMPRQIDAKLDLVRVDYRIGGKEKAETTLRGFAAADGDNVDLKLALGGFLREQKDYPGADAAYHEILRKKSAGLDDIVRAKNEMAALAMAEGKKPQAEKLIAEILAADSKNPDALIKRAGLKIDAGETDEAIGDLRVVLGEHPESTPARLLVAAALEQKGDTAFAESEYAQAVENSNHAAQPSFLFAKFLLRHGKAARAEKILAESAAVDPTAADNLKLLAAVRLDSQNWRGAEEAANALKALDASDDVVSGILGAAYSGLKDYAGAIDVLKEAHDRSPSSSRPLVALVQAYIDAGRVGEAEDFLKETIANNPSNYGARVLMAQVQRAEGKDDAAMATLREAVGIDALRPEAYETMYGVAVLAGQRDEAGRIIEQAVSAIPDNDGLQILKADQLIAIGDNAGAIAIYEVILARRPDDLIVANNLASLLAEREDSDSIKRAMEAALALKDSENPYFLDTYGWAMVRGGQPDVGIAALEKAAKAAPTLTDARYHLGVALMEHGDSERGQAELQAVVSMKGASAVQIEDARRRLGEN